MYAYRAWRLEAFCTLNRRFCQHRRGCTMQCIRHHSSKSELRPVGIVRVHSHHRLLPFIAEVFAVRLYNWTPCIITIKNNNRQLHSSPFIIKNTKKTVQIHQQPSSPFITITIHHHSHLSSAFMITITVHHHIHRRSHSSSSFIFSHHHPSSTTTTTITITSTSTATTTSTLLLQLQQQLTLPACPWKPT